MGSRIITVPTRPSNWDGTPANMKHTGGGIGSNQYQTRGTRAQRPVNTNPSLPHLLDQVDPRRRCGDVWQSKCQSWVYPPNYQHKTHPNNNDLNSTAACTNTDPDILNSIATHHPTGWGNLAANPNCPPEAYNTLNAKGGPDILEHLAHNRNCPPHILKDIWDKTTDAKTIRGVAAHPNLPTDYIRHIATQCADPQATGRNDKKYNKVIELEIARNPSTPPDILRQYLEPQLEQRPHPILAATVHHNPSTPPDLLISAAQDYSTAPVGILTNPSCPPQVYTVLAKHPDPWVRRIVAKNTSTPTEVALTLVNDPDTQVRQKINDRPDTPPHIRALIQVSLQ